MKIKKISGTRNKLRTILYVSWHSQMVNPSEPRLVKNWKFIIIAMCIFYALCFCNLIFRFCQKWYWNQILIPSPYTWLKIFIEPWHYKPGSQVSARKSHISHEYVKQKTILTYNRVSKAYLGEMSRFARKSRLIIVIIFNFSVESFRSLGARLFWFLWRPVEIFSYVKIRCMLKQIVSC